MIPRRYQTALLTIYGIGVVVPAALAGGWILNSALPTGIQLLALIMVVVWCAAFARLLYRRTVEPLRGLSNLLEALRLGDVKIRGRRSEPDDVLGEVYRETNRLADELQARAREDREASGLLRKVLELVDVAILSFDESTTLIHCNAAAQRLLNAPERRLEGCTAAELGLKRLLEPGLATNVTGLFGSTDRFAVRCVGFRSEGKSAFLLTLSDLSQSLRDEERQAWRRLIRVLGHEINNAMVPIISSSQALGEILASGGSPEPLELATVISREAQSLRRFVGRLAEFAKLPPPNLQIVALDQVLERAAATAEGIDVNIEGTIPQISVSIDEDQIARLMGNILANAAEAQATKVFIGASVDQGLVTVTITDNGSGIGNPANLFTPFFSTKPGGSGIGLLICSQISEAHGGTFDLRNRRDGGTGCVAIVTLRRR